MNKTTAKYDKKSNTIEITIKGVPLTIRTTTDEITIKGVPLTIRTTTDNAALLLVELQDALIEAGY